MEKKYTIIEIAYTLAVIVFSAFLKSLNNTLLALNFSSSFDLLAYNNYLPIKFFFGALVLVFLGACLCFRLFWVIQHEMWRFQDVCLAILFVIWNILLVVRIIVLINNPILRAVLGCTVVIVGLIRGSDL